MHRNKKRKCGHSREDGRTVWCPFIDLDTETGTQKLLYFRAIIMKTFVHERKIYLVIKWDDGDDRQLIHPLGVCFDECPTANTDLNSYF